MSFIVAKQRNGIPSKVIHNHNTTLEGTKELVSFTQTCRDLSDSEQQNIVSYIYDASNILHNLLSQGGSFIGTGLIIAEKYSDLSLPEQVHNQVVVLGGLLILTAIQLRSNNYGGKHFISLLDSLELPQNTRVHILEPDFGSKLTIDHTPKNSPYNKSRAITFGSNGGKPAPLNTQFQYTISDKNNGTQILDTAIFDNLHKPIEKEQQDSLRVGAATVTKAVLLDIVTKNSTKEP